MEDIGYVLVEQTEGDAALRVNSGEPREGLNAYVRVYLWLLGTTELALTEKMCMPMHPNPVKYEHEIVGVLERWSEQDVILITYGHSIQQEGEMFEVHVDPLNTLERRVQS